MARTAARQGTEILIHVGKHTFYFNRPEHAWQLILLDVVSALRRHYNLADSEIMYCIENSGPDAIEEKAAILEIQSRVGTGMTKVEPRTAKGGSSGRKSTGLSGGETKKAKAKVSKVRRDSGKNKKA
jgi:hypothetical protein